jgi:hypothetical protein
MKQIRTNVNATKRLNTDMLVVRCTKIEHALSALLLVDGHNYETVPQTHDKQVFLTYHASVITRKKLVSMKSSSVRSAFNVPNCTVSFMRN